jgi:hypothetical protein
VRRVEIVGDVRQALEDLPGVLRGARMNKTAWTDAGHILDSYRAQQVGTVVCVKSFGAYDTQLGGVIMRAGQSYLAADHPLVERYPENFGPDPSDWDVEGSDDDASIPDVDLRSDSSPPPDVSGLLVCVHAFEFEDPDTGYLRGVRYGFDYVEPDDWLAEHYPENFVRVEYVVPSDGIAGLPLRDDDE